MNTNLNEELLWERCIKRWGVQSQVSMTMGECGELIAALNRYYTQGRGDPSDVVEELADVQIMINQMKFLLGEKEFDEKIRQKISRLRDILDGVIEHPHKGNE